MPASHTIGTITAQTTGTANPSLHSFTVAHGDTVLVLFLLVGSATLRTGGAPTYAGRTMTAGPAVQASTAPETSIELWYLIAPPVGTANVSVPNAGALNIRLVGLTARSSTGATAFDSSGSGSNTGTNPSVNLGVTFFAGCITVAMVGTGATLWAPSARAGTQIWDTDHGAFGSGGQYLLQAAAGASANMTWTEASSDDWACAGIVFRPGKGPMKMQNYQQVSVAGSGISVAERIR